MSRFLPVQQGPREPPDMLSLVRETAEYALNGDPSHHVGPDVLERLRDWGASVESRDIILDVVKVRLGSPWPYNYKALTVLALMPTQTLTPFIDLLKPLAESQDAWLRLYASPLLAVAEAQAKVEEDRKKKEESGVVWNVPTDIPWGHWAVVQVGPEMWWKVAE